MSDPYVLNFGSIKKISPEELKKPSEGQSFNIKELSEASHAVAVLEKKHDESNCTQEYLHFIRYLCITANS